MNIRRIVTKNVDGIAIFAQDGSVPHTVRFESLPGFQTCLIWADEQGTTDTTLADDRTLEVQSWLPEPGGSRLLSVTFPPDSVWADNTVDVSRVREEQLKKLPGLAEQFEVDAPGMHRTDSLDYGIVLEGEIWLELDNGAEKHLKRHDVVVQTGTRHAWRNKGNTPATMLFVLLGR